MSRSKVTQGRPVPKKPRRRAERVLRADTIQARRIVITDYKSRPVIEMRAFNGGGALMLMRPDGQPLIVMGLDRERAVGGGGFLGVCGPKGEPAATLWGRRQGGQVRVTDAQGNDLGCIGAYDVAETGGAVLILKGRDHNFRVRNGQAEVHPVAEIEPGHGVARPTKAGFGKRLESLIF